MVWALVLKTKSPVFWQSVYHGDCFSWSFNDSGEAAFDWIVYSYGACFFAMSVHGISVASAVLAPVSLSTCTKIAVLFQNETNQLLVS